MVRQVRKACYIAKPQRATIFTIKCCMSPKLREKFLIRGAVMLASKYEIYEKVLSHIYDPGPYKVHFDKGFI